MAASSRAKAGWGWPDQAERTGEYMAGTATASSWKPSLERIGARRKAWHSSWGGGASGQIGDDVGDGVRAEVEDNEGGREAGAEPTGEGPGEDEAGEGALQ